MKVRDWLVVLLATAMVLGCITGCGSPKAEIKAKFAQHIHYYDAEYKNFRIMLSSAGTYVVEAQLRNWTIWNKDWEWYRAWYTLQGGEWTRQGSLTYAESFSRIER